MSQWDGVRLLLSATRRAGLSFGDRACWHLLAGSEFGRRRQIAPGKK
jgi:hypothetical protein